ncbi:MAG: HDIG domain-containing protein [Clostridia bacterium]|nr:HDIG domain-containing protein [Clostridia bacterium]
MRKMFSTVTGSRWTRPLAIWLLLYGLMFVMLITVVTPERYDIKTGYPAPVTIFATKDVEDTYVTEKLRNEAAAAVDFSYGSIDSTITSKSVNDFSSACTAAISLRDNGYKSIDSMGESQLAQIQTDTGVPFTKADITAICSSELEDIEAVFTSAKDMVRETLTSTLPEGQETTAISKMSRELQSEGHDHALVTMTVNIIRATLQPNMLIDEETTALNRQKARDMVEVQMCVKGEAVVREGDIVSEGDYLLLDALGLIKNSNIDTMLILGIALIILLVVAALMMYVNICCPDINSNPKKLILLALIIVIVMGLSMGVQALNTYLMPVSLGIMLVATLLDTKLALFVNIILGFVTALFASATSGVLSMAAFSTMIMAITSGPLVVMIVTHKVQRTSMLLAGLVVGIADFLTTLGVGLINSASMNAVLTNAVWAAGGGILSAVICIGLQPLMEWMFNLVTNAKLLELSNPNQPLLHRLLLEAPGTYHHSIIVANLADAAASAIGANALLARVGAYYHDIGKLKRPMYFKENQLGDNPHDRTDPRVSAAILTAHPRDGFQMAQKEHLPAELLEIICSHHGDSPVLWFYDKAKKLYGDDIDINAFRYDGPRPARRETAVVMLADVIEAATRSMPTHEPQKVEQMVRKLVRDKMNDGQLDRSQLNFDDLDKICHAFITVLTGVFHERIEYPDVKLPPRQPAAQPAEKPAEEAPAQPAEEAAEKPQESAATEAEK